MGFLHRLFYDEPPEPIEAPEGMKFVVSKTAMIQGFPAKRVYLLALYPAKARVNDYGDVVGKTGRVKNHFAALGRPHVYFTEDEFETERQKNKVKRELFDAINAAKAARLAEDRIVGEV